MTYRKKGTAENNIESWMLEGSKIKDFEHYTDIHIDQITSIRKYCADWIEKSFSLFRTSVAVKNKLFNTGDCILALYIELGDFKKKQTVHFKHVNELTKYLSWTPPSFYLFKKGSKYFDLCFSNRKLSTIMYNGKRLKAYKFSYYRKDDKAFVHSIWILDEDL